MPAECQSLSTRPVQEVFGLSVLPLPHWSEAGAGAGSGRGAPDRRTGASSARVTNRAWTAADPRERLTVFLLDIAAAVEEFKFPCEGGKSGLITAQCWLEVARSDPAEVAATADGAFAERPKRSFSNQSGAVNKQAAGHFQRRHFQIGIEDQA